MKLNWGALLTFINELLVVPRGINNIPWLRSVVLLTTLITVPIFVVASPALILFWFAKTARNPEPLYIMGVVWLFLLFALAVITIVVLLIVKIKQQLAIRRYAKTRQSVKRRWHR